MAKPLLKIHCETKPYCTYPIALKVAMDDGTVQTYVWHETKKAVPQLAPVDTAIPPEK